MIKRCYFYSAEVDVDNETRWVHGLFFCRSFLRPPSDLVYKTALDEAKKRLPYLFVKLHGKPIRLLSLNRI